MSYEHQARIRWSFTTHPANDMFGEEEPAALKELDRVYAQAAKADEYEAKAKAFDEIKVYMQSAEDKLCDEEYFNEDVYEEYYGIIESVIEHHSENESGESDA